MKNVSIQNGRWGVGEKKVLLDGQFGLTFLQTRELVNDGAARAEPPAIGGFPIYRASDFTRIPAWWNFEDLFLVAPSYGRTGFFLDFSVPDRTAVIASILRVNPRDGEAVDPYQGVWGLDLKFPYSGSIQNFYTPGTNWGSGSYNPTWVDGWRKNETRIRQFLFEPRIAGHSVDDYVLPEDLRGSDTIMVAYFQWVAPIPKNPSGRRTLGPSNQESFSLSVGVSAGGEMRQNSPDIPATGFHGERLWARSNWGMTPSVVTIRVLPSIVFDWMRPFTRQEPPQRPGQDWLDASNYPLKKNNPDW